VAGVAFGLALVEGVGQVSDQDMGHGRIILIVGLEDQDLDALLVDVQNHVAQGLAVGVLGREHDPVLVDVDLNRDRRVGVRVAAWDGERQRRRESRLGCVSQDIELPDLDRPVVVLEVGAGRVPDRPPQLVEPAG
jgi:hypothetical protein